MALILLLASIVCFAIAGVAILRPEGLRDWMRQQSPGVLPEREREFAYGIAPTFFAIVSTFLGIGLFLGFVSSILR